MIAAFFPLIFMGYTFYRQWQMKKYRTKIKGAIRVVTEYKRETAKTDEQMLEWIKLDNRLQMDRFYGELDELGLIFMPWQPLSKMYRKGFVEELWKLYQEVPQERRND